LIADHFKNDDEFKASLWQAADNLRANSSLASNEYFLPILGLIFLRQATNRYYTVVDEIEADKAVGKTADRGLVEADFTSRRALMLPEEARYDVLLGMPKDGSLGAAVNAAMESVEGRFPPLAGQLPKDYERFEDDVLEQMMRQFDSEVLRTASGDVLGRIYEYFLGEFSKQGAHDSGEFFTPPSIVQTIVNVIEPDQGIIFDPACGSGGMFVQSSYFVEDEGADTMERVTFYGHEKNPTTARMAQINLAVHGLEGKIRSGNEAITYYKDPHELIGKCDFVMANPPFNVDKVDSEKVKGDKRLPFGLPGVNKDKEVSNANYLWLQYFYSYLNESGRAGVVMSSQATSADRDEAKVRQKMVESGAVDMVMDIRTKFFYTRGVPCQLWFLDRAKEYDLGRADQVLMLDARNVYRKVTRKIYDFSPEQQQNLLAIVWLYRGETERFLELVSRYLGHVVEEGQACFEWESEEGETLRPLPEYAQSLTALREQLTPFLSTQPKTGPHAELLSELEKHQKLFVDDVERFGADVSKAASQWEKAPNTNAGLNKLTEQFAPLAESSRNLVKQTDLLYKLTTCLIDTCEKECCAKASDAWVGKDVTRTRKAADEARQQAVEQLKQVRYFLRQAQWLTERFPAGELCDVEGLVKLVDRDEIKANDWSLTPGRYVGVAPEEEDEDFDFEEGLRSIHIDLKGLNEEAEELAARITQNFEELGA
jgi:type I restriction enzyme M protein